MSNNKNINFSLYDVEQSGNISKKEMSKKINASKLISTPSFLIKLERIDNYDDNTWVENETWVCIINLQRSGVIMDKSILEGGGCGTTGTDDGNKNAINEILEIVKSLNTKVTNIETDVKDLKVRVTNIETDVKDLKVRVTNLENDMVSFKTEIFQHISNEFQKHIDQYHK